MNKFVNKGLVSICIPVYNRENVIEHTVQSAINQTYQNIEIIISDNNSDDRTLKIVSLLANEDSRIKILKNSCNSGPVMNWKKCFDNAKGDYIKFLWSDDYIDPSYIEEAINKFDENTAFVYSSVKWYNVLTKLKHERIGYKRRKSGYYKLNSFCFGLILGKNYPVSASCSIFRRVDLAESFIFSVDNKYKLDHSQSGAGIDALMFLILSTKYDKYYFINKPLVFFGLDEKSITITNGEKLIPFYFTAFSYYIKKYVKNKSKIEKKFKARLKYYYRIVLRDTINIKIIENMYYSIEKSENYLYYYYYIVHYVFDFARRVIFRIFRSFKNDN